MSKKCIVNEGGRITDVCEAGDEFEIYDGEDATIIWMDIPDDFTYNEQTSRVINGDFVNVRLLESTFSLTIARKVAYGEIGEQLDMQYRDKINNTTEWEDYVTAAKASEKAPSLSDNTDAEAAAEFGDLDREEPQWEKI